MRIFLMADTSVGLQVAQYLKQENENVVGLAIHPPGMQNYSEDIKRTLGLPDTAVFDGRFTKEPQFIDLLRELKPDILLTACWGFILKPDVFRIPPQGCINFHAAYLPYNRGKNPNVWSIIDGTPAGVTLHYIDEGIDTGDIIGQTQVKVEITDTAKTVYEKMISEFFPLFKRLWPEIKSGKIKPRKQDDSIATFHWAKDFRKLDEIDLNKQYLAKDLIDLLRARTFPPHPSAFFMHEGKKIYVRISLEAAPSTET